MRQSLCINDLSKMFQGDLDPPTPIPSDPMSWVNNFKLDLLKHGVTDYSNCIDWEVFVSIDAAMAIKSKLVNDVFFWQRIKTLPISSLRRGGLVLHSMSLN